MIFFGAAKLTKNADPDKYKHSGYDIGFDSCSEFLFTVGSYGKNFIIFGAYMSASVHVDNKGKNILILGEGLTQGLDDTTLRAEAKYSMNFTQSNSKFVLNLHYNGSKSFLFVNATKIHQFKANDSQIKKYPLCLGNTSKEFTPINIKKAVLNGYVYEFSVHYTIIDNSNIISIHKYLMKKTWYKIMYGIIKKMFIVGLSSIVNAFNYTKCALLSNQKCQIQATLINLILMNTVKNFTTIHLQLN